MLRGVLCDTHTSPLRKRGQVDEIRHVRSCHWALHALTAPNHGPAQALPKISTRGKPPGGRSLRFIVGGLAVSAFSILETRWWPKSFAGHSARPCRLLWDLLITLSQNGAVFGP
jgi:hypothetical protein